LSYWAGTLMVKEAPYKSSFGVQFSVRSLNHKSFMSSYGSYRAYIPTGREN
jgi:hypothetical protein